MKCQSDVNLSFQNFQPNAKINLEFAAKVIHGPYLPDAVMKTRIRRLYDIANILQSLHLIQKVQITESHGARKPAFEYIGPDVKGLGKALIQIYVHSYPVLRKKRGGGQHYTVYIKVPFHSRGNTRSLTISSCYSTTPLSIGCW